MTLTTIEKAAKLIGHEIDRKTDNQMWIKNQTGRIELFNPYTNKADLMDVECAIGIDVYWINNEFVHADSWVCEDLIDSNAMYKDHPNKFTARAHAVMDVVEQIYDAKYGKDGE